jgi:hypothetical protein
MPRRPELGGRGARPDRGQRVLDGELPLRKLATLLLVVSVIGPGTAAAAAAAPSTTGAGSAPASTSAPATPKPAVHSSATPRRPAARSARRRRSRRARQGWRAGQMAPTPERYKEIQQALIGRGYSSEPLTGEWGPQWTEALKRFQQDQNIPEATGKLNALSLIALGLGPKRDSGGLAAPAAPAGPTAPAVPTAPGAPTGPAAQAAPATPAPTPVPAPAPADPAMRGLP